MAAIRIPIDVPELDDIRTLLVQLNGRLNAMTQLTQEQINTLAGSLDTLSTRLTAGIDAVRADIADIKAANEIDTTALDASLARVQAATDALSELDAENPAPVPAEPVDPSL